jgi:hypothetical protein
MNPLTRLMLAATTLGTSPQQPMAFPAPARLSDERKPRGGFGRRTVGRCANPHYGRGWIDKLRDLGARGPGHATGAHKIVFSDKTEHIVLTNGQHINPVRGRERARRAVA